MQLPACGAAGPQSPFRRGRPDRRETVVSTLVPRRSAARPERRLRHRVEWKTGSSRHALNRLNGYRRPDRTDKHLEFRRETWRAAYAFPVIVAKREAWRAALAWYRSSTVRDQPSWRLQTPPPIWPCFPSQTEPRRARSEERRVGEECRSRWEQEHAT